MRPVMPLQETKRSPMLNFYKSGRFNLFRKLCTSQEACFDGIISSWRSKGFPIRACLWHLSTFFAPSFRWGHLGVETWNPITLGVLCVFFLMAVVFSSFLSKRPCFAKTKTTSANILRIHCRAHLFDCSSQRVTTVQHKGSAQNALTQLRLESRNF